MQALLSLDRAPPFAAPLRFFLSAPLFATLAGILLVVAGPDMLASRWTPAALAATHLVTVGFMLQVMAGALIQILPVVAGANLANPVGVARTVHGGLTLGAAVLAGAFLAGAPAGFVAAALVLGGTLAVFLLATGRALLPVPSTSPTIRGLKIALGGLAGTAGLGVSLALALAFGWPLAQPVFIDLHASWGLGAWSGVLLMAMAYVVVPMFQLTPAYPARLSWWFPAATGGLLAAWTVAAGLGSEILVRLAEGGTAAAGMAFAAYTLYLQRKRRRARVDATILCWQGGMGCGLAALAMLLAGSLVPDLAGLDAWPLLFGVVLGVGGFMSLINGMLYKIVPFLAWLHLQSAGQGRVAVPNVNKILSEERARSQTAAHFAAVILLAGAVLRPEWLAWPAGVAFAVANGWLAANLFSAARFYRRERARLTVQPAA